MKKVDRSVIRRLTSRRPAPINSSLPELIQHIPSPSMPTNLEPEYCATSREQVPRPIPDEKLEEAVELYSKYLLAQAEEALAELPSISEGGNVELESNETADNGYMGELTYPTSADITNSDISSVISFTGNRISKLNSITFHEKTVKARAKRRAFTPARKMKIHLIRLLGVCSDCRAKKIPCPLSHQDLATLQRIIDQRRDGPPSQMLSDAPSTFTHPKYEHNVERDRLASVNNESSQFCIKIEDHQNELFKPGTDVNLTTKHEPLWSTSPIFSKSTLVAASSESPGLEIAEIIRCNFPNCTSTFLCYKDRNRHEEAVHTIPNQYPCPIPGCPWLGSTELIRYEDHMTTMHIESAPIMWDMVFKMPGVLNYSNYSDGSKISAPTTLMSWRNQISSTNPTSKASSTTAETMLSEINIDRQESQSGTQGSEFSSDTHDFNQSILGDKLNSEALERRLNSLFLASHNMSDPNPTLPKTSVYENLPLDRNGESFRLLVLHPRNYTELQTNLYCGLIHANFHTASTYEALSCTWENNKPTNIIFLDGKIFPVEAKVYKALRSLRKPDQTRFLWVNTICINKADKEEADHQLKLLDRIYNGASKVVMCVDGFPDPRTRLSRDNLLHLATEEKQNAHRYPGTSPGPKTDLLERSSICSNAQMDQEEDCLEFEDSLTGRSDTSGFEIREPQSQTSILHQALTLTKNHIVNRIMEDFWMAFDQKYNAATKDCPSGQGATEKTPRVIPDSQKHNLKRKRKADKEQRSEDEGDGQDDAPRPKKPSSASNGERPQLEFACPFRKHDPYTYNPNAWRVCATAPQKGIFRVKDHLFRYHRVFQCLRCKSLFSNQEEVDSHLTSESCEVSHEPLAHWIKAKVETHLRIRKKTYAGQTEVDRWGEIYKMLFPSDKIPSAYFEPVIEEGLDPGLYNFEDYSRKELPRVVREAVEKAVESEIEAIQRKLQCQIGDIFQQCLDTLFLKYRASISQIPENLGGTRQPPVPIFHVRTTPRSIANQKIERDSEPCPEQNTRSPSSPESSGITKSSSSIGESLERTQSNDTSIPDYQTDYLPKVSPYDFPPAEQTDAKFWHELQQDDSLLFRGDSQVFQSFQNSQYDFRMEDDTMLLDPPPPATSTGPAADPLLWTGLPALDGGKEFDFDSYLRSDFNASM